MSRMTKNIFLIVIAKTLFLISLTGSAQQITKHIVVAPHCLIKQINIPYQSITSDQTFSLIEVNDKGLDALAAAKNQHKTICGGFMDVTDAFNVFTHSEPSKHQAELFLKQYVNAPQKINKSVYSIKYEKQVNQLLSSLNPQLMWNNLIYLSNFDDRHANSDLGVEAANWIKSQVEKLAEENHRSDVTVYVIATGTRYKQPSVIAKIGNANEPGIVIGGHMDTLASMFTKKPGADDDGSGSVTVLELARNLLSSGMHFKKPIYLMWYAAEEEGLVGSGYVVSEFKKNNIPIDAVLHFDMTGYAYNNEQTMWLISDYVDQNLTQFLETLIKTYVKQAVKYTRCGYACSDHASWTQQGFTAGMSAEAAFEHTNPNLHSSKDTIDKLSLNHMTDYVKLATAFAVELAEPV